MLIPAQRQWFHHGFEHDVGVLLVIEKNPASCSIAPLKQTLGTRMRIASLMADRGPSLRVTGACNAPH